MSKHRRAEHWEYGTLGIIKEGGWEKEREGGKRGYTRVLHFLF